MHKNKFCFKCNFNTTGRLYDAFNIMFIFLFFQVQPHDVNLYAWILTDIIMEENLKECRQFIQTENSLNIDH